MLPKPVMRSILRNDPNRPFIDDWDRFFNTFWDDLPSAKTTTGAYPVDIDEDDHAITVDAELPGFKAEDVDVNIHDNVLTIRAERSEPKKESGKQHLGERRYSKVERTFTLPTPVDEQNVEASLKDGILQLRLPKEEKQQQRKIEVKSA